jgi:UDP-3-O-[3-hydroxymyristoyl] N-acetylglucosamine deacetylase / 3-hydroxyacyl-[acyl-carrier-protein] dehydratase
VVVLQKTVARRVEIKGLGLHTGTEATLALCPAPLNTGLVLRVQRGEDLVEIPAVADNVSVEQTGMRNTTLSIGDVSVKTVEHILSALAGMGVTNCYLDIKGEEIPEPGTGGVMGYLALLDEAGLEDQGIPSNFFKIDVPIEFEDGNISLQALPADDFRITFHIDYQDELIGTQDATFTVTPDVYRKEIAPCRTFVLQKDVEKLQAMGLAKGGSLDNAMVVDDGKLLNEMPLQFPDEFVRHKILDLIGDLSLVGLPIQGHIIARYSGHDTNVAFAKVLRAREKKASRIYPPKKPEHWDIVSIMNVMPHRYPLLLVDRILELEAGKRVVGIKNVTINEQFFEGHFPHHPIMPAVLITEAMAQCGGVLLMSSVPNPKTKLVYFSGIDGARFRKPVVPGDQLRFELELIKLRGPLCKMKGVALVDGEKVAEADLMSTIVDR